MEDALLFVGFMFRYAVFFEISEWLKFTHGSREYGESGKKYTGNKESISHKCDNIFPVPYRSCRLTGYHH